MVQVLVVEYGVSVQRACRSSGLAKTMGNGTGWQGDAKVIAALPRPWWSGIVMGALEVLPKTAAGWPSLEPQADLASVLPTQAQPAMANKEAASHPGALTACGTGARQCPVVHGLHRRYALWRQALVDLHWLDEGYTKPWELRSIPACQADGSSVHSNNFGNGAAT